MMFRSHKTPFIDFMDKILFGTNSSFVVSKSSVYLCTIMVLVQNLSLGATSLFNAWKDDGMISIKFWSESDQKSMVS